MKNKKTSQPQPFSLHLKTEYLRETHIPMAGPIPFDDQYRLTANAIADFVLGRRSCTRRRLTTQDVHAINDRCSFWAFGQAELNRRMP